MASRIRIARAVCPPAQIPPSQPISPRPAQVLRNGTEFWRNGNDLYLVATAPLKDGKLYVARRIPSDYLDRAAEIQAQTQTYEQQKQHLRAYKREIILALLLITLLLLFTTTWVALFLSKQVTVPIQALAEATREISRGNFDHQIDVQAQDELGTLVRSFNRMTEQLGEGRKQINEFTQSLELAIEERERRRKLMEAILENIPTGVVSLNSSGEVTRVNSAVVAILGAHAREAHSLQELLGEEGARAMLHLMRRSLRMGAASREIEIATSGKLVRAAVTVSSLGPRRSNPGFIIVIDDLTDLLRAQKASAWQEVAQRIAHEIKNPLTPIQLSAQRLLRHIERSEGTRPESSRSEFEKLVAECAGLIEREVYTLESLVDEFSQFARFPAARLSPADVNSIVAERRGSFPRTTRGNHFAHGTCRFFALDQSGSELLRRVVANLIDNAAEAMEGASMRQLRVSTRAEGDGDAVAIEISDSGHGISPEDKERLFLPHFSTKERGTGLGLAIASRIVAEHNGTIRVEDNVPDWIAIRDSVPGDRGACACGTKWGFGGVELEISKLEHRVRNGSVSPPQKAPSDLEAEKSWSGSHSNDAGIDSNRRRRERDSRVARSAIARRRLRGRGGLDRRRLLGADRAARLRSGVARCVAAENGWAGYARSDSGSGGRAGGDHDFRARKYRDGRARDEARRV